MPTLNAYLSFDGNCAAAMKFYERVLEAKLETQITYAEAPMEQPCAPGASERIMHAHLVHKDFSLMAGDTPPGVPYTGINGMMLALTLSDCGRSAAHLYCVGRGRHRHDAARRDVLGRFVRHGHGSIRCPMGRQRRQQAGLTRDEREGFPACLNSAAAK